MNVAMAGCPTALYARAHDRAVSASGDELRTSLELALAPPDRPRTRLILERITAAMRKGTMVDGVFLNVEPFGRMCDLLAVLPVDVPDPEIVVESEREIGLDWHEGHRRVLALTVDDTPYVGFAALFGHEPLHGRMPFAGALPETLAYLFERLYPTDVADQPTR